MPSQTNQPLTELRHQIDQHFNLAELKQLSFDLSVDFDYLVGNEKKSSGTHYTHAAQKTTS